MGGVWSILGFGAWNSECLGCRASGFRFGGLGFGGLDFELLRWL